MMTDLFESESSISKRLEEDKSTVVDFNKLCSEYTIEGNSDTYRLYLVMKSKSIVQSNLATYSSYHI
jgi:hypothetical protein